MSITKRHYTDKTGFNDDYYLIQRFLRDINSDDMSNHHYMWGRWEWAHLLPYLDTSSLGKIPIWLDNGTVVATVLYDDTADKAYPVYHPGYAYLLNDIIDHVLTYFGKDGEVKMLIDNNDVNFGSIARNKGFKPITWREENAVIEITDELSYTLPEGFSIISFEDEYDVKKHNKCLHRGFNHEGDAPETEEDLTTRALQVNGPSQSRSLLIAVKAPNGDYASYCGMWHKEGDYYCEVEPVATDPTYRKMGLGRAAVLEGVIRCGKRGAKVAYVGSGQQFYYNIGFNPVTTGTMWEAATK